MKRVLIIEYEINLLRKNSEILINEGYEVLEAGKSSEGIQKAIEFLPDIILCDSEMPGLNGYEVYITLQEVNSTCIIPFIFIIPEMAEDEVRFSMNMGVDDYIKKPFKANDLVNVIKTRLRKQEKIFTLADEKFNTLMDFWSNGIFILDENKLNYVNKQFCMVLGYESSQLLGMNLINIVYKDDIRIVAEKLERILKGIIHNSEFEFRAINNNQQIIKLSLSCNGISIRGKKCIIGNVEKREISYKNESVLKSTLKDQVNLTKREKEILHYICKGMTNHEISKLLQLSERTVEGHRIRLLKKTKSKNSARLAIFAIKNNLYTVN